MAGEEENKKKVSDLLKSLICSYPIKFSCKLKLDKIKKKTSHLHFVCTFLLFSTGATLFTEYQLHNKPGGESDFWPEWRFTCKIWTHKFTTCNFRDHACCHSWGFWCHSAPWASVYNERHEDTLGWRKSYGRYSHCFLLTFLGCQSQCHIA